MGDTWWQWTLYLRYTTTMFIMQMPKSFRPGDTADVKVNYEPKRLHWTNDGSKLIILAPDAEPDERQICLKLEGDDLATFYCEDAVDEDVHRE